MKLKKFFNNNHSEIKFLTPIILGAIFLVGQFLLFVLRRSFLNYFNVDISFYATDFKIELTSFVYYLVVVLFLFFQMIFVTYSIYYSTNIKEKNKIFKCFKYFIFYICVFGILMFCNYPATFLLFDSLDYLTTFKLILIFSIFSFGLGVAFYFFFKNRKELMDMPLMFKILLFLALIIAFISVVSSLGRSFAENKHNFYIIDNNKIVIYNNANYAIVTDYVEIDNDTFVLYSKYQKKVDLNDLQLEKVEIKNIIIK